MSFLTPDWSYVDALVHPAAQRDVLTAAHIASSLRRDCSAALPRPQALCLARLKLVCSRGSSAPILIVYYLSRTDRYESARVLFSLSLAIGASIATNDRVKKSA